ncbi:phosphoenolpyruvate carboxylase, partial [Enterobacter hormaechei]
LHQRSRLPQDEGKEPDPRFEQALMVTIAGVAAGMRNTGKCSVPRTPNLFRHISN